VLIYAIGIRGYYIFRAFSCLSAFVAEISVVLLTCANGTIERAGMPKKNGTKRYSFGTFWHIFGHFLAFF